MPQITWDGTETASGAVIELSPTDPSCTAYRIEIGGLAAVEGASGSELRGVFYFLCAAPEAVIGALVDEVLSNDGRPVKIPS